MDVALGTRIRWPGLDTRKPAWDRNRARSPALLAGAVVALGVFALLTYLYLPKTTVVLYPPTTPIEDTIEIRADPGLLEIDVRGRRLPSRVGYVVVAVVEQATTAGRLPDPTARALGTLTLVNRAGGVATVPAGTIAVSASGVRFATAADATLADPPGATARVAIQAVEPGEPGNLGRLEVSRLIGPFAQRAAVLNEEPTVGGGRGTQAVISADDVARARRAAAERARIDALGDLRAGTLTDEMLLTDSVTSAVVEESLDHQIGDVATGFTYRLKTRVSASRIGNADLKRLVGESWQPAPPPGFFLPEHQLEVGKPLVTGSDGGTVTMRVPVKTLAVRQVDAEAVRDAVRGRGPDAARRELAHTLPLVAEPRVAVQPSWFGRALRVDVALDLNPPPTSTPTG